MKAICKIAGAEFRNLFYTPVGWLILIVFCLQFGYLFVHFFSLAAVNREAGWVTGSITDAIFTHKSTDEAPGVLVALQQNLYLYLPLITMGLISRETSSGSIKLLSSAPIKVYEIVCGKYLAILLFGLIFVFVFLLFLIISAIYIPHLDVPKILSGLFGVYLLLCCYGAIGLFMSSLSSYQVVNAVTTLIVFSALNYVGTLWQRLYLLRDIANYLSIRDKSDQFIGGLINSVNVFYFLILIGFFLGLTILKLQGSRWQRNYIRSILTYLALVCLCALLSYLTSLPHLRLYVDLTADKENTLSKETQQIIKKLKGTLYVRTYVNILDDNAYFGMPEFWHNNVMYFEPYQRFMPDMTIAYTYYYNAPTDPVFYKNYNGRDLPAVAREFSKNYGIDFRNVLTPTELKNEINLKKEEYRVVWQLECSNKKTFMRLFNDLITYPGEQEFASALKRLTLVPSKIVFLEGDGERSINSTDETNYRKFTQQPDFRESLINQGFNVLSLSLDTVDRVPLNISALVIADPKKDISPKAIEKIEQYVKMGGNLLVASEPEDSYILNPLLNYLGVQIVQGTLLQRHKELPPEVIKALPASNSALSGILSNFDVNNLTQLNLTSVSGLEYKSNGVFKVSPVLFTDKDNTWNHAGVFDKVVDTVHYEETGKAPQSSLPIALAITRTVPRRQQRIFLIGDADFMSDAQMDTQFGNPNSRFALKVFSWLSNDEFPVYPGRNAVNDIVISINHQNTPMLDLLFLAFIPLVLTSCGAILLINRMKK